ncbi:MAG: hypothetical protein WCH01_22965 [Methylococcaceae bacterium]
MSNDISCSEIQALVDDLKARNLQIFISVSGGIMLVNDNAQVVPTSAEMDVVFAKRHAIELCFAMSIMQKNGYFQIPQTQVVH